MRSFEAETRKQQDAAATRVQDNAKQREHRKDVLAEKGGIARADEPRRVAARIDRLSRYHSDIRPIDPAEIATEEPVAMAAASAVLERIINTEDFLSIRYLEAGVAASRAVGRVNIRDERGRVVGYGTGSLVSPALLLTNHHVLPDAETAVASTIEFDYQDGIDGRPLQPKVFPFDPDRFFLANEELDFALVAVRATTSELAGFSFNRLIEAEGKAIVGDFVSIIQHPGGEKKQVALRENQIVDLLDLFVHYETDTEPGSSGSPVFNDQWEIVALHHASVPSPEHDELGGFVNEGIRVSRLITFIKEQALSADRQALIQGLLGEQVAPTGEPIQPTVAHPETVQTPWMSVPLEIRVGAGAGKTGTASARLREAITIDPDFAGREGYDPDFLGTREHSVPLPTLSEELVPLAAINSMATSEPHYVLPYHHFSVVLNKDRGLAFFTASNIDGNTSFRLKRETDRWFFDPRVPEEEQTGEDVYRDNPLDRGHLVRRLDPAWGSSSAVAKLANDDTFHFTNCTPQHEDFNQNQTTWAGLEDYILESADNRDLKVSVFTGPVLATDDEPFKGVQLPRQFWKVVVMVKGGGELSATGYLLSQEELIRGLEFLSEEFSYGAYSTFQVPIRAIEELTGLSFGSLVEVDPLAQLESRERVAREITRPEMLLL
jgi:endonuclease G, mitochondrial